MFTFHLSPFTSHNEIFNNYIHPFYFADYIYGRFGSGRTIFCSCQTHPRGDKFGHFFLMGILSFLVNVSLNASKIRVFSLDILKGSFIIWILVTLEEISQVFLQFRSFSFIDLACDYCGIFCFGKIAACYLKNKNCCFAAKPSEFQ